MTDATVEIAELALGSLGVDAAGLCAAVGGAGVAVVAGLRAVAAAGVGVWYRRAAPVVGDDEMCAVCGLDDEGGATSGARRSRTYRRGQRLQLRMKRHRR